MAETYTPAEIAARWKCSPDKVWAAIASKKLKAVNTCFRANAPASAVDHSCDGSRMF